MSPWWVSSDHLVVLCGPQLVEQDEESLHQDTSACFSNRDLSTLRTSTCPADGGSGCLAASILPKSSVGRLLPLGFL